VQCHFRGDSCSVFIRKCVAPIRALIVPKGCSTVSRRWRIFSEFSSSPDPSLGAGRAAMLYRAALTRACSVTTQNQPSLFGRKIIGDPFSGRTNPKHGDGKGVGYRWVSAENLLVTHYCVQQFFSDFPVSSQERVVTRSGRRQAVASNQSFVRS
jgi:hypothetical protein